MVYQQYLCQATDEIVNTNEPIEYYDRPRATYDETMDYTVEEFEKAAQFLPVEVSILDFGKPSKGAAYALIARLRLIHASPLFKKLIFHECCLKLKSNQNVLSTRCEV